jgi:hypothetical protein
LAYDELAFYRVLGLYDRIVTKVNLFALVIEEITLEKMATEEKPILKVHFCLVLPP